ncbi:hypothetical protein LOZ39_001165 [Ophidiomyces ophidiicola]|uniref:Uncharacterized protein n=1 Tax=Ophidiomyces ophidiicola TaxID=1387563 RepID=A0ACB8UTW2_9EURO|nr:uncharacterized protein LOZ57_005699 [Ophidiomyces ophidiicola]KAI1928667.1 hypothetical protein LOZ60_002216 [Ophidiomyces ophidiicola]KAI1938642.1 hypothetical protein LOZ66_003445 [Ophidiomyces ophidiicola]KAI1941009.1 hypothetical protein LOZ57_005699 [Ophidiomyces ophidiicola]KAI2020938.1 hypothetical protein LOZ46_002553 [Ophidiomyces ophidiicola]KAI2028758.1 hypothetical protein LOZ45_002043 [Ophidiomyces ophidiicola]
MLRINALTSTPILIDAHGSHAQLLSQIQNEVYARAPEITEGYAFDGLYVEWDLGGPGSHVVAFPHSSILDKSNLAATLALLRTRSGKDMLCLKVRVSSPDAKLQLA